jgi:hypothetical protein
MVRASIMAMTYDGPEQLRWVRNWLKRWEGKVHVVRHAADNVFTWDVEGPADAIAEVPDDLQVLTPWSQQPYPPVHERKDRRHGGR